MKGFGRWAISNEKSTETPWEPTKGSEKPLWKYINRFKDIFILIALIWVMRFIGRLGFFQSAQLYDSISRFGVGAPLVFILLCAVSNAAFVPPSVPIGVGAIAFGKTKGALYSLLGITCGACLAFFLGRHATIKLANRLKKGKFENIDKWMMKCNKFLCMLSLRLIFFSNPMFNYASSVTQIPMNIYIPSTFIGLIPRTFMFSYFFELFMKASFRDIFTNPIVLSFPLLRVVGIVLLILFTRSHRGETV